MYVGKPVLPLEGYAYETDTEKQDQCLRLIQSAGSVLVLLFNLHVKESRSPSLCSGQKAFCRGCALNGGEKALQATESHSGV